MQTPYCLLKLDLKIISIALKAKPCQNIFENFSKIVLVKFRIKHMPVFIYSLCLKILLQIQRPWVKLDNKEI